MFASSLLWAIEHVIDAHFRSADRD